MKFSCALLVLAAASASAAPRPFDVRDLATLDRVSDQVLSPDGRRAAVHLRETDYEANRGANGIWTVATDGRGAPVRLTDKALNATAPRWSADGASVYFLAPKDGVNQLWRVPAAGGEAIQVSRLPLDVGSYKLAPDGKRVALTLEVFVDCQDLACTRERLDKTEKSKASGRVYDALFVRHWDTWSDGRRSQLFVADVGADGLLAGEPRRLSRGIDNDIPSKPFGDDSEYAFAPDGSTVYFGARNAAGSAEASSTNFDLYAVAVEGTSAPKNLTAANPAWDAYPLPSRDGKTLYYLAMKRPGFEADRFDIRALDLASGQVREIAPAWDRSASALKESFDGRTLYTAADDWGQHPLFAVDVASGKVSKLVDGGTVAGFDVGARQLLVARQTLKRPSDLFVAGLKGGKLRQITRFNAERLAGLKVGDAEFFTFKGWNEETVQGYVVKPVDFQPGRSYPVAFIIHGGPQGAMNDGWSYRWNPQTYAGQGFAVVTINFHGSTGYGQAFTDSISGDWGGKPLEDLKRGWQAALARYDFLDADRACALGASYGGYMINWIAGNWNEPWKCLVNHDGVFDTRSMGYVTEELWFTDWENGGAPFAEPENYERFNPVNHVAQWRVPMLVVQGEKDYRVPIDQGLSTFTALQRRGIPSRLLYFPDENHWVLKPQNSVTWHETVNAWLKRWTAQP
ncbi:alpha/beta hydrolase family protein [Dokdonella koreensis]|uniref:Dipeptidyl aminopeptidase/acylaminoacyl peptidase n=1 Tax=Dokdonella koreensis DS-123 TaxID=1300342 RepID=A0A160DWM8_9GAMM|nr:S9 family peptidase [Dokdonella koreensis]ANB19048.1 Dipeptidyl aminopeptidase/acylaminoacyl peptidase [Dokdonella koreensis DS-123]